MEQLPSWAEWVVSSLIIIGSLFALVGSIGLARLPDFMARLHAPTKSTTLGVGGVILGSIAYFSVSSAVSMHELLITIFLFLTAPISAHLLAKAGLHLELRRVENTRDLRSKPQQYSDQDD